MPQQKHISIFQIFGARTCKVQRKMLRAYYLPFVSGFLIDLPLANYCIPGAPNECARITRPFRQSVKGLASETRSGNSLVRARLSRSKERVWSNCILRFVIACPRNPWHVNWFIYHSDVL